MDVMYKKMFLIGSLICFICAGVLSAQPVGLVHQDIRTQAEQKPKKITLNVEQYNGLLREDSLYKNEIQSLNNDIKGLTERKGECEKKLDSFKLVMNNMPPLTTIKDRAWTEHNITRNELLYYFGLNKIDSVFTSKEWDEAYKNQRPVFCYHQQDREHEFGVLLNIYALQILIERIQKDTLFRLPIKEDFDALNAVARSIKLSPTQIYTLGSGPCKWEIGNALNLFGFNLPALSYRRKNEGGEWQGGNTATIYCHHDLNDSKLSEEGLRLAGLSISSKDWFLLPYMSLDGELGNIGTYVRLIYKY